MKRIHQADTRFKKKRDFRERLRARLTSIYHRRALYRTDLWRSVEGPDGKLYIEPAIGDLTVELYLEIVRAIELRLRLDLEIARQMAQAAREQLELAQNEGSDIESELAQKATPHITEEAPGPLDIPMATIFATIPEDPSQKDEPAMGYYFNAPHHVVQRIEAAVQQAVERCFEKEFEDAGNASAKVPESAARYVTTAEHIYSDFVTNDMQDFTGVLQQTVPGTIISAENIEILDEGEYEAAIMQIAGDDAENDQGWDIPPNEDEILGEEPTTEVAEKRDINSSR